MADTLDETERLRAELEHAKAALAGDNEGIRLWMLDCAQVAEMHRRRWQALKDHLTGCLATFESLPPVPGDDATTLSRGCHVSALRSVLARMDELSTATGTKRQEDR